jgi:hypothetical protein
MNSVLYKIMYSNVTVLAVIWEHRRMFTQIIRARAHTQVHTNS